MTKRKQTGWILLKKRARLDKNWEPIIYKEWITELNTRRGYFSNNEWISRGITDFVEEVKIFRSPDLKCILKFHDNEANHLYELVEYNEQEHNILTLKKDEFTTEKLIYHAKENKNGGTHIIGLCVDSWAKWCEKGKCDYQSLDIVSPEKFNELKLENKNWERGY